MADHKLWNRADVRAEMNRIVKDAGEACKTIRVAAGRIAALGVETGFNSDAQKAVEELRKRSYVSSYVTHEAVQRATPSPSKQTWGERGCTCGAATFEFKSHQHIIHGLTCSMSPLRPF